MFTIYLAGPLFSEAERNWHNETKRLLIERAEERHMPIKVIWPYELISQKEIESLGTKAREEIFRRCKDGLDESDIVVALLDGVQVDDGTAWEVGYFYGTKSNSHKIIGIRTDFRKAGESVDAIVNAMIEVSCTKIVYARDHMISAVFESYSL